MTSDPKTVEFIVEQMSDAGSVAARPMFGEYGVYCAGKMIGIIGDDQLFIKPTAGGRAFAEGCDEAPPYPQAKPYLRINEERWDDREWLTELARITASELPAPKPKRPRSSRGRA